MKIGMTFDLRDDYLAEGYSLAETAELDVEETIAAIQAAIVHLGYDCNRIGNLPKLVSELSAGASWDLVFNIAEGMHGASRESQVPSILEAYEIPYTFSDPLSLTLCLNKATAKDVVRMYGLNTAEYFLIQGQCEEFQFTTNLVYPVFVKPCSEGSGIGVDSNSLASSPGDLRTAVRKLIQCGHKSLLVEQYLPGAEFTVGIVGAGERARIAGIMEVEFVSPDHPYYSYHAKTHYKDLVKYHHRNSSDFPDIASLALGAWRALQCRDGGRMDIRLDAHGVPYFLEVNPLPGLNPDYSDLPILCSLSGISYTRLVAEILEEAMLRSGLTISSEHARVLNERQADAT